MDVNAGEGVIGFEDLAALGRSKPFGAGLVLRSP